VLAAHRSVKRREVRERESNVYAILPPEQSAAGRAADRLSARPVLEYLQQVDHGDEPVAVEIGRARAAGIAGAPGVEEFEEVVHAHHAVTRDVARRCRRFKTRTVPRQNEFLGQKEGKPAARWMTPRSDRYPAVLADSRIWNIGMRQPLVEQLNEADPRASVA